ncbi:MAG TPA: tRNA (adenosine(37)-N6)-threonylcarbamoyltransferase complex transferase subunit TsaD [Rhodospirillaceae bacterium]|nr:MAG: tRNA (adenosine(37)-N6)-threonylcarbamoyltransferase complex transferase subunit TsaD [Alphaproteobacteria bacterium GWF2_58_20]HAU28681.1 tRNA (adenosine(37)-N6)-threonylcarbamoyltransferase complex transferase subunit TsaD [Rhodospirillaceae bacterium]
MIVLGIETSCDETAAALVTDTREILSSVVFSQIQQHQPFGGVVPEIAARSHLDHIETVIRTAMGEAGIRWKDLSGIAATCGPGLIGGVIVGATTGKALAAVHDLPFIAVNHLEGHALTVRLTSNVPFPYLLLLASGGHCQLLLARDVGDFVRLGGTIDDAAGEAFDKVAKLLGLDYPGGPEVEKAARGGNPKAYALPRPMKGRPGCDFSFSGLKTAVRHLVETLGHPPDKTETADICASFQAALGDSIIDRTTHAIKDARKLAPELGHLVVAGGVAANQYLRERLTTLAAETRLDFVAPPLALCTDNAAMVAWCGVERLQKGLVDGLEFAPRPRWPLAAAASAPDENDVKG